MASEFVRLVPFSAVVSAAPSVSYGRRCDRLSKPQGWTNERSWTAGKETLPVSVSPSTCRSGREAPLVTRWICAGKTHSLLIQIPENISFDQAASVPLGLATVLVPNFNHNPQGKTASFTAPWEEGGKSKYAGKPAFILGGASSVGQYGAFIAKTRPVLRCSHRSFRTQLSRLRSSQGTHPLSRLRRRTTRASSSRSARPL